MITCFSKKTHFDTWFTNGKQEGHCDAPVEKGGCDAGFGPHELLEAALASCLNIYVRVCAKNQNISLAGVVTEVTLEGQNPGEVVFRYALELKDPLTEEQRWQLIQAAQSCPVHQTLAPGKSPLPACPHNGNGAT